LIGRFGFDVSFIVFPGDQARAARKRPSQRDCLKNSERAVPAPHPRLL